MEHEVFVPVEVERLREVLDDPARVARAVPGLQHDAGADPVTGRLKVRVGSHSVTYRGAVRVSARDDGSYAVEGDAVETRGSGSVQLALRLRLRDTDGGTTLTVDGTATADGRVTDLPPDAVTAAASRLLNRFAENLGTVATEATESAAGPESPGPESPGRESPGPEPESPELLAAGDFEPQATTDFETTPDADDTPPSASGPAPDGDDTPPSASGPVPDGDDTPPSASGPVPDGDDTPPSASGPVPDGDDTPPSASGPVPDGDDTPPSASGPVPDGDDTPPPASGPAPDGDDTPPSASGPVPDGDDTPPSASEPTPDADSTPPPAPEPAPDAEGPSAFDAEVPAPSLDPDARGEDEDDDSVAEAAHARRTMIGRSAEEVDHAPPRGRYAPVPAPQTVVSPTPLRWAAPAAALAVASAVVAIRALRRRH